MKILQLMAGGPQGGAETAFIDMCLAMHEAGEHIVVATRANDLRVSKLKKAGIEVHELRFGGMFDFVTPRRLQVIIKEFQPDIVQSWMSRASSFAPKWTASMGVPRYYTVARLGGYYKLKYFKNIEYFVGITPCIVDYLVKAGVPEERTTFINNFAEVGPIERHLTRKEFGIPEDVPLLLGLGRLHETKAFDVLINAVADIDDVYLCIAGEGPLRDELESLIDKLGLEERVKLLGWRDDRAALFELCDICTFISRDEPFGTVFAQSWAQKTPVIVSDADGPRQFVRDGEDGLMVPRDDVDALRDAIEKLKNNNDLKSKLVENGCARYKDEFTKSRSVSQYLKFYESMIERGVSGGT